MTVRECCTPRRVTGQAVTLLTAADTLPPVEDEPVPLRTVVGDRVRALRESVGARQQDLSDAAKELGLDTWTRTRIAALERGSKAISAEDLVRLVAILGIVAKRRVDVAEMFDDPRVIELSAGSVFIPARKISVVLCGGSDGQVTRHLLMSEEFARTSWHTPEREADFQRASAILGASGRTSLPTVGETRTVSMGMGEADERARRDLGLTEYPFETLCLVLWGRSLSGERDARLNAASASGDSSPGSVAARRGRITRALLAEARRRLSEFEGAEDVEHQEAP